MIGSIRGVYEFTLPGQKQKRANFNLGESKLKNVIIIIYGYPDSSPLGF
jgi:hypothetical protein